MHVMTRELPGDLTQVFAEDDHDRDCPALPLGSVHSIAYDPASGQFTYLVRSCVCGRAEAYTGSRDGAIDRVANLADLADLRAPHPVTAAA